MTMPLRVVSVAAFLQQVEGQAPDYRAVLREACRNVPRRINRFIQLSLIGAHQCVNRAGRLLASDSGVYLGSANGTTEDTATMMHQVFVEHETPSPVTFINSSTNVASYYLAQTLKLRGRNLSIASAGFSFEAALELACLDLAEGIVPMALVGAVDQRSDPLGAGVSGGFDHSFWLLLGPPQPQPLAEIEWVRRVDRIADVAAWTRADAGDSLPRFLALGRGLAPQEERVLSEQFAGRKRYAYRDGLPDFDGVSAYGIVRFIEAGQPGRLMHISGNGQGGCYGISVTVPRR